MGESKLLKITGIIMIIGAAISLLIGIAGLAIGGTATAVVPDQAADGMLIMLLSVVIIVAAALQLVAGIMGVRNWNKPDKAQTCFILGIVIIALSLVSNIVSIATSGFTVNDIISMLIGLVLPILYVYGASQLKKSA